VVDFTTWQQLASEMAALPLLFNAPLSERHATRLIDDLHLHEKARMRFAELEPRLTFTSCPAEEFLATTDLRFGCAYSVFGAVGFVDPHVLLPLVRRCLTPDGRLIFSVRHPECDSGGPLPRAGLPRAGRVVQHKLPITGAVVRRLEFGRTAWSTVLSRYGFRIDQMHDIPAPAHHSRGARARAVATPCCLLVTSTIMNTSDVSRRWSGRWGGTRRW
jgi:SAM-dependent methyltransferase